MVLLILGKDVKDPEKTLSSLSAFTQTYRSDFLETAEVLKSSKEKRITAETPVLYVNQREFAVISNQICENVSGIGTDMATTCHMVILRCPVTKVTGLGHFDGVSTQQGITDMTNCVVAEVLRELEVENKSKEVELDLHIAGGFDDHRGLSEELSLDILNAFYSYKSTKDFGKINLHLKTFCASGLNTTTNAFHSFHPDDSDCEENVDGNREIKCPVVMGVAVNTDSGNISRAVFEDDTRGPRLSLRSARSLNGVKKMANVYRTQERCFVIEPFTYQPMHHVVEWLSQPDIVLRKYMSTSPDVEPENFESLIRKTLHFIYLNPDPMKSIFHRNKPLLFEQKFINGKLAWTEKQN